MTTTPTIHPIRTYGTELRFLCGPSPASPEQSDALAINPLAPAEVLISAATDRIDRIKQISALFGFMPDDAIEAIPAHVLTGLLGALHSLANEADQLMSFADKAKRGAA